MLAQLDTHVSTHEIVHAAKVTVEHNDQMPAVAAERLLAFRRIDGDVVIAIDDSVVANDDLRWWLPGHEARRSEW